jgi:hypothetical protein
MGGSGYIHFGEVIDFVHALGSEWPQSVYPEFFFVFPLRIGPMYFVVTNHY